MSDEPMYSGRLEKTGGRLNERGSDFYFQLQREGRHLFAVSSTGNTSYSGEISHDPATNTIRAHLIDEWQFGLLITGTHRDHGYDLAVEVTIPQYARIPLLDDEAAA